MKQKYESSHLIKYFITNVKNQFQTYVKTLRSDNSLEFTLQSFYLNRSIHHQTSHVDTPHQNFIVERKHQHFWGVTHALLFQSQLPKQFWVNALYHVVF